MKWVKGIIKGQTSLGYASGFDPSRGLFQAKNSIKSLL